MSDSRQPPILEQPQSKAVQAASAASAAASSTAAAADKRLYESTYVVDSAFDLAKIATRLHETMLSPENIANPLAPLEAAGLKITKSYIDAYRRSEKKSDDSAPAPVPWGERAVVLHNVVTPEECALLAALTEQVEMHDPSKDHRYRNMMRCELRSAALAKVLFARIAPHIAPDHVKVVDASNCDQFEQRELFCGTWTAHGMNDHFRACYYDGDKGDLPNFGPHRDGYYSTGIDCCSIKTFMIYLNSCGSDYEGGTTNFLADHDLNFDAALNKFIAPERSVLARLPAQAGDVLLFDHALLHEGAPVLRGRKYIFRSEVMYVREGNVVPANEREARELLMKAAYFEDHGDGAAAVACYRKAFKLCPELERHV